MVFLTRVTVAFFSSMIFICQENRPCGFSGTPGILSNVLQVLSHHVEVFATYTGVNSFILNVSDIQMALRLLKKNNIVG